jgi:hypothetical protein
MTERMTQQHKQRSLWRLEPLVTAMPLTRQSATSTRNRAAYLSMPLRSCSCIDSFGVKSDSHLFPE